MNNTMNKDNRNTDEITNKATASTPRALPEAGAAEIIEFHIYDAPPEEAPPDEETIVESTGLVEELPCDSHEWVAPQKERKRIRLVLSLVLISVLVLALIAGCIAYFVVLPLPVDITLIPVSKRVQATDTMTIVTGGHVDISKGEVAGRSLSAITISQAQTTPTTGTTIQPALPAHGTITFYNAATAPQTLGAFTLITGKDGVQVVTDEAVSVPEAVYPTFGMATVSAHAVAAGPEGNIAAHDLDGDCCFLKISATNASAFVGGQAAESYQSVAPSDIESTAGTLSSNIHQSVAAALSTQVHTGETLVSPPTCETQTSTDYPVGARTTRVQVTVSATCMGVAYEGSALSQQFTQAQQPMAHYRLSGEVQITGESVTPGRNPGTYALSIQSTATWVYAFSPSDTASMAKSIAGKSPKEATHYLLHTTGVQSVSLSTDNTLPSDPQKIHWIVVVQG
jgi:hypothetical protein